MNGHFDHLLSFAITNSAVMTSPGTNIFSIIFVIDYLRQITKTGFRE